MELVWIFGNAIALSPSHSLPLPLHTHRPPLPSLLRCHTHSFFPLSFLHFKSESHIRTQFPRQQILVWACVHQTPANPSFSTSILILWSTRIIGIQWQNMLPECSVAASANWTWKYYFGSCSFDIESLSFSKINTIDSCTYTLSLHSNLCVVCVWFTEHRNCIGKNLWIG